MSRLDPIDPASFTHEQQKVYNSIMTGPRGKFGGPFPALIHAPDIADKIQALGASIRFNSTLPSRLREVAILCVARYWRNEVEWNAHVVIAINEGLSENIIKNILLNRPQNQACEKTQLVVTICSQLQQNQTIKEDTYARSITLFSTEQIVELISIVGYFTSLSMVLNAFEIDSDSKDGVPPQGLKLTAVIDSP